MEKIEVRYKKITVGVETPFYHKYIIYTDSNGKEYFARGGPGNLLDGNGILGQITTLHGAYVEGAEDWDYEHDDPSETIFEGDDLSSYWQSIEQAM